MAELHFQALSDTTTTYFGGCTKCQRPYDIPIATDLLCGHEYCRLRRFWNTPGPFPHPRPRMVRSAIRGRHSGSHSFHPGHMLLVDSTGPDHGLTLVAEVFTKKIEYYTFYIVHMIPRHLAPLLRTAAA
ncbi:MAG: hypothetical protein ACREX9_21830 [Gammaproteobacteria bacterium]